MDEDEEYYVEAIRKWRYNYAKGYREYYIKWQGYTEEENTWEPEDNLNCPEILTAFRNNLNGKDVRYYYATDPSKLTGFQRHATFVKCLGADGPHDSDDEDSPKLEKQKFYCLIKFEDSNYAEEVTLKEFYTYEPERAMEFCEQRLIYRRNDE